MVSDVPAGRPGQPEDFIGTALWLATAASAFVTGAIIRVDGGAFRQM
jgi:NAD(P)-dependent dehydrogenase (short-subunit alcohol dehydrogenase family)